MAVVILIKRTIPDNRLMDALPLFTQLRRLSLVRPGYISGATLKRIDNPDEYLVMSTWELLDDWHTWESSEERRKVQAKIDALIGGETKYEIYDHNLL